MAVSLTLTRTEHVQWARLPDAAIGRAAYVILKMLHHVSPTTALLPSPPPRLLPALRHHCLRGSSPRGPSSGARSATAFSATTAAAGPQVRKGKVSWRWAPQHRSPSLTGEGAPRLPPHSCRSLCVCASSFHLTLPPPSAASPRLPCSGTCHSHPPGPPAPGTLSPAHVASQAAAYQGIITSSRCEFLPGEATQ